MSELPGNWHLGMMSDVGVDRDSIVDGPFGSNLKISDYIDDASNGIPVLTTKNLRGDYSDSSVRFISQKKFVELQRSQVNPGDILVAKIGSVGKTGIYPKGAKTAIIPANLLRITVREEIEMKYVYYYVNSPRLQNLIKSISTATAQPAFNVTKFRKLPIPLPPRPEQKRIVAKIEELFSDLDKAIESLKKAQAQLKTYRQAVLKYAFEGRFTGEWRDRQNSGSSGIELKRLIHRQREELKDKKTKAISTLTSEELDELPSLPHSWCWCKLGELTRSVKDGPHYSPKYVEKGIPFITGGQVRPEGVDFSSAKQISKELHDQLSQRCKPAIGDILYTKGGTTGIARVNTYDIEFNVWVHVAVLKIIPIVNPFYLQHALNSDHCYRQSQKYTHGVGNQDLGLTRMILISVPVCPLEEQEQVVSEIDKRLSLVTNLENAILESLEKAEATRQSILKKAFEGRLV